MQTGDKSKNLGLVQPFFGIWASGDLEALLTTMHHEAVSGATTGPEPALCRPQRYPTRA